MRNKQCLITFERTDFNGESSKSNKKTVVEIDDWNKNKLSEQVTKPIIDEQTMDILKKKDVYEDETESNNEFIVIKADSNKLQ